MSMQDVGHTKEEEAMIPLRPLTVSNGDPEKAYRPYQVPE